MKRSPLQLQSCYFTRVNMACQPEGEDADLEKVDLDIEVLCNQQKDNPREWYVFLTIKLKPLDGAKSPFKGEIENMGAFTVADSWPEKEMEKLVYINGAGILYAAC